MLYDNIENRYPLFGALKYFRLYERMKIQNTPYYDLHIMHNLSIHVYYCSKHTSAPTTYIYA